jgi:hypothetical protein
MYIRQEAAGMVKVLLLQHERLETKDLFIYLFIYDFFSRMNVIKII